MRRPITWERDTIIVRECITPGCIRLETVISQENAANALAKALLRGTLEHLLPLDSSKLSNVFPCILSNMSNKVGGYLLAVFDLPFVLML